MRHELKVFRVKQNLKQEEMAAKLGVTTGTYSKIENGKSRGSQEFWLKLQNEFNLEGGEVWKLQINQI